MTQTFIHRETWRNRTTDGVIHGSAVRAIEWGRTAEGRWVMIRSYWEPVQKES